VFSSSSHLHNARQKRSSKEQQLSGNPCVILPDSAIHDFISLSMSPICTRSYGMLVTVLERLTPTLLFALDDLPYNTRGCTTAAVGPHHNDLEFV
jgi:hypothetical protein